jgi:hypothetical protein
MSKCVLGILEIKIRNMKTSNIVTQKNENIKLHVKKSGITQKNENTAGNYKRYMKNHETHFRCNEHGCL